MKAKETAESSARALAEAQLQVAGHGVRLRDVVERHHHDAEEEHRRDGADPVPVRRQNAVLVGRAGPAHQLQRAQVGRDEAEAGDPRRHLAAGEEELLAGVGLALHIKADEDHQREIKRQNQNIYRGQLRQPLRQQSE